MQGLSAAVTRTFEDRMVAHVRESFQKHFEALGEPGTREAIRYGIKRAGSYGVQTEQSVGEYIKLMFAFGRDFDQDANCPWAAPILNDESSEDPEETADRLIAAALDFLQRKAGSTAV